MNKYQEALELLKEYRIGEELRIVDKLNYNARLEKIIDLFQELVDKATPMKPIGKHTSFKCGRCGTRIRSGKGSSSLTKDTVCRNCYQVIDWSEDE